MKCAICKEEKPDAEFSKSQLKKGAEAKCAVCSAQAASEQNTPTKAAAKGESPAKPSEKACAHCKRTGVQFSKAQQKKEDGKCVDCVQAAENEASGKTAPSSAAKEATPPSIASSEAPKVAQGTDAAPSSAKTTAKPKDAEAAPSSAKATDKSKETEPASSSTKTAAKPKDTSAEDDEDDEDSIRICCESCQVFKPTSGFDKGGKFCSVCADAKRKGLQQTTMKDHGLVASDGSSHRRISWVPEGFKEYLAFMAEESGQPGEEEEGEGEMEDDEDGGFGY